MSDLTKQTCEPCEGKGTPLDRTKALELLAQIAGWKLTEDGRGIYRVLQLNSFTQAVETINRIAQIAESQNHHPDVHLTNYKYLRIDLTTHAISGLSENDFIVAAKINAQAQTS